MPPTIICDCGVEIVLLYSWGWWTRLLYFGAAQLTLVHFERFFEEFSMRVNLKTRLFIAVLTLITLPLFPWACSAATKAQRVECDVHAGPCSAVLSGCELRLDISPKPVKAMQDLTFTVTLTGEKPGASPYVDLGMVGMNMGRNRVALKPVGEFVFRGNGVIVRCPSGRRTWKAKVTLPDRGSVEFIFNVIY